MSDSKVFMFPDAPCQATNGTDPATLMAMMNNGGFGNGNWMWIIFLFFLYGWGRNGNGLFGGNNGSDTNYLAGQAERDMLMQAINGNGAAVQNLATNLNCDVNSIKTAINSVQSSIAGVGNQVGLTGQQVINAIQQGNMSLAQQFAQCCCDNKLLITQMGYEGQLRDLSNTQQLTSQLNVVNTGLERGFSSVAYGTAQQTCALQNSMKDQTQTIIDKLSNMEANAQQEKINNLTAQLTAANSRAERAAELKPIIDELSQIRSAQPNTVSVQYPQVSVIPNYNGYNGMSCGCNNGQGFWY